MSIYIGDDLEDRLEALEALETENESAKKMRFGRQAKSIRSRKCFIKKTQ